MDTADTSAFDGTDLDVTLVTPGSAPGVSDDVVLFTTLRSVTNGGDGVVEAGSAFGGVHDTTGVHLEDALVSLDGNGDNTLVKGSLQLGDAVFLDLRPSSDLDDTLGFFIFVASTGLSMSGGVWVVGLEDLSLGLQEVEGFVLPSTVATVACLVAGNDLLLGEAQEVLGGFPVSELGDSGGTESPA